MAADDIPAKSVSNASGGTSVPKASAKLGTLAEPAKFYGNNFHAKMFLNI